MSEKSHVTMEQHQCPICLQLHDTGAILLDRQLRPRFERNTVTGLSLCAECQKMVDDDRTALVEIDEAKSNSAGRNTLSADEAYRTGAVAWVRNSVWDQLFNVPKPAKNVMFVSQESFNMLRLAMYPSQGNG
jgi:hypothetical protein